MGFSVVKTVVAEYVFNAIENRRTGALLNFFSLNGLVLSGGSDENLSSSLQIVLPEK